MRRAVPPILALVLITGVGPLATDAYLPALPALQRSLHTSAAAAQLTLTAFLIGMALGQLVIGPISDGSGRRPVLIASTFVFLALSVVCAIAPSAGVLIAARLLQGVAAGGAAATGRAVVSDHFAGQEAAKRYGTLASVGLLGPVVAPPLGSLVLALGTWRDVFVVLTVIGVVMLATVLLRIPESLDASLRQGRGLGATVERVRDLLTDRGYMRHVLIQCFATMGFFGYIGGSSFALETVYGIDESTYAAVFTVNALAMVATSVAYRLLVARVGSERLRSTGLLLATGSSLGLVAVAVAGTEAIPALAAPWLLLSGVTAGMGLMIPASMTLAQEAGRRSGGTAAALSGGLVFGAGALVTPLTGVIGYTTLRPMALLMAGFFGLSLIVLAARGVLARVRALQPLRGTS